MKLCWVFNLSSYGANDLIKYKQTNATKTFDSNRYGKT